MGQRDPQSRWKVVKARGLTDLYSNYDIKIKKMNEKANKKRHKNLHGLAI